MTGSYRDRFLLFSKLPNCFLKCWHHIAFPSAVYNSFSCSTFWPVHSRISLFNYRHSIGCLVASHCATNLISGSQARVGSFFNSLWQYLSLIDTFRPLIFRVINDMDGLKSWIYNTSTAGTILNGIFYLLPFFFPFFFVWSSIIFLPPGVKKSILCDCMFSSYIGYQLYFLFVLKSLP